MGHARALLALSETADQLDAARQVIKKELSVRDTERLVRRMLLDRAGKTKKKADSSGNADIRRLEVEITDKLGAKVRIDHSQKGSGKLVIQYNSLDELDGILKHIK
jgi:ParB family chromosome partitioning protein